MWTDRYCPKCGLKLAEVRGVDGNVEPNHVACRNSHEWNVIFNPQKDGSRVESFTAFTAKEEM